MENFDTEKIEQYLKGQLNITEQKIIADQIAMKSDFAKAVALHQLTMNGIEQFGLNQIQEHITDVDKDLEKEGFFLTTDDIDNFLDKKIDTTTHQIMEHRLTKDAAFKAEVELHQFTRAGIKKEAEETAFSDLFNDLDKDLAQEGFFETMDNPQRKNKEDNKQKEAKIVRFPFHRLAIAASIALIIFAAWWVFQPVPTDSQIIYANQFTPLDDVLSIELEETGFVKEPYYDLLENAMKAYNDTTIPINSNTSSSDNYRKAKDYFIQYRQTAPITDDFYPTATLYLAISHLEIQESAQAILLLASLTQQNFPQQVDAQWYLALSYIKTKQTEKAIPILKDLAQTKYQAKATVILKELQ